MVEAVVRSRPGVVDTDGGYIVWLFGLAAVYRVREPFGCCARLLVGRYAVGTFDTAVIRW
jgi:hypothetical protein